MRAHLGGHQNLHTEGTDKGKPRKNFKSLGVGLGRSSVEECLPSIHKALGSPAQQLMKAGEVAHAHNPGTQAADSSQSSSGA